MTRWIVVFFLLSATLPGCVGETVQSQTDTGTSQQDVPDAGGDADTTDATDPDDAVDTTDSAGSTDADTTTALYIYDDSLNSAWIDASWDASVDLRATGQVFAGTHASEVTQQPQGGLSFLHGDWGQSHDLDPADFRELSFSVYATQALEMEVLLEGDGSYARTSVGTTVADQWTTLTVALSELSPSGDDFHRLDFLVPGDAEVTYFIDEIRLTGTPSGGEDAGTGDTGQPDGGTDDGGGTLPDSEFVTVDPNQARFLVNGEPFYFVGTNLYWMVSQHVYGASFIDDSFDMCEDMGLRVVRFWGFGDGHQWTNQGDPAIMQPEAGVFNESAFEALDYIVSEAGKHGVRLIIPLINYWEDYGGMLQYARWTGGNSREYFYTASAPRQLYKDYVDKVLTRVNTITGVEYRNDPTIMAWELANEARAPFDNNAQNGTLEDWYIEMAAYIRSVDSNHLIATGGEGWDISSYQSEYSDGYTNDYALRGADGSSYIDNTSLSDISFGGAHLYPDVWGFSDAPGDGRQWIADHARLARREGKPFVLGEFGNGDRSVYADWLQAIEDEDAAGSLMWQIVPASRGRENNMTIVYPDDSDLVTLFKNHAQYMNSK